MDSSSQDGDEMSDDMAEVGENQCVLCLQTFDSKTELGFHQGRHKLLQGLFYYQMLQNV